MPVYIGWSGHRCAWSENRATTVGTRVFRLDSEKGGKRGKREKGTLMSYIPGYTV